MRREEIAQVYKQHGHAVVRRAAAIMGNAEEGLEVVQEVFLSLLDRPEQFGGRSSILTWLYSATTHRCLNALRNRRTRSRLLAQHGQGMSEAVDAASEELVAMRQVLTSLPPPQAEAAIYHFLDGMTHQEIADVMGCSRRHIGNLIVEAQARVQHAYRREQEITT